MNGSGFKISGGSMGEALITNGLILKLDASDPASYPGTGSTIYNAIDNSAYTITGTQGTDWSYDTTTYPAPIFQFNNNTTSSAGGITLNSFGPIAQSYISRYCFTAITAVCYRYYGVAGGGAGNSMAWCIVDPGYGAGARMDSNLYGTPGTAIPDAVTKTGAAWTPPSGPNIITPTVDYGGTNYNFSVMGFTAIPPYNTDKYVIRSMNCGFFNGAIWSGGAYVDPGYTPGSYMCNAGGGVGSVNGYWAMSLFYDRSLSDQEMLQIYRFIKNKWNLPTPTLA